MKSRRERAAKIRKLGWRYKMIHLHVWGDKDGISIISPECIASEWILCLNFQKESDNFKVVPSSNTDISDCGKLPVLVVEEENKRIKYEGFTGVCRFLEEMRVVPLMENGVKYLPGWKIEDVKKELGNVTLEDAVRRKFEAYNNYNLYINNRNYEAFTRKLFPKYLPFPMMYNQSLQFFHEAQDQASMLGFQKKTGVLSWRRINEVNDSEYYDEEKIEPGKTSLNSLHERKMKEAARNKEAIESSKGNMKFVSLVQKEITSIQQLYKTFCPVNDDGFSYLFSSNALSSSEILLYAYIYALTHPDLPDHFLRDYIEMNCRDFYSFSMKVIAKLNKLAGRRNCRLDNIASTERATLLNHLCYLIGIIKY